MRRKLALWFLCVIMIFPGLIGAAADEYDTEIIIIEDEAALDVMIQPEEDMDIEDIENINIENINIENMDIENVEEDTLILAIEELDTFEDMVEIPLETENAVVTEECVETHQVSEAGLASVAKLPEYGIYSRSIYSGSYGAQLERNGLDVYEAMCQAFLEEKSAEKFTVFFSEPYEFDVEDLGCDTNNKRIWNEKGEDYLTVTGDIKYHVQSAYDAFMYDSPQAFWVSKFKYSWGITFYLDSNGCYAKGKISSIVITPEERYAGAVGEIYAFEAAVDAVAAEIAKGLSKDAGKAEIIEEIHDWLCLNVEYQDNTYAHTAAGVFLKGKAVVCEGYAKAFHILCREYGIESVLIPGGAKKSDGSVEGHMWNYVNLDGYWYMIDTTWDDQEKYISKKYFLAGNNSAGFNAVIKEERTPYTVFSPAGANSRSFILPVLNESAYSGTWHEWNMNLEIDVEATCVSEGSKSYHCRKCGTSKANAVVKLPVLGHVWGTENVSKTPSCTEVGQLMHTCTRCRELSYEEIPVIEHTYGEWKVTKKPKCEAAGIKSRFCKCGAEEKETIAEAGHSWGKKYITERKPTCTTYGIESIHCTKCDVVKKGSSRKIARLDAIFTADALVLKIGQTTNKLKVSGLTDGDYIKSWSPSNKKIIDVTEKGKIIAKNRTGKANVIITLANDTYGTTRKYKIPVTVQKKEVKTVQISGLKKNLTIKKGKKYTLKPVRVPFTSKQKFKYSSKKTKIASVSSNGVITAKSAGKTKITVYSGDAVFKITVTVPETVTERIDARKKISVKKGKSVLLKVKRIPANSDQGISFASKNKKVAIVDQKGRITGKKKGKTKIIITSGAVTHTCTVTVN